MPQDATTLFADLVSRADSDIHLPAAALAIARIQYPHLDMDAYLGEVAELARSAARAVATADESDPLIPLHELLFEEYGFDGDRKSYYDPRNSFLNDVLERRRGIPITLSVLYLEAGRAAGIELEGVGFPGHFIVYHSTTGRYVDVYNQGRFLDRVAFMDLLRRQGIAPEAWRDDFLVPVSHTQMLSRMLNNLRRHYTQEGNQRALLTVAEMTHVLEAAREQGRGSMVQ
ncbi:MAG TPA: transglutaminase-like domain-containing protein [Candidatus Limnocylindrales bacterium]|nr:transglutaminase-like domain-containing protein [Candidatus Limnocylindrales bacterium]